MRSGSGASNFITGAGGFLQALSVGYGGIRILQDRLDVGPIRLPNSTAIVFRSVDYRNMSFDISLAEKNNLFTIKVTKGNANVTLTVYSTRKTYKLYCGKTIAINNEKVFIQA